jgi:hypothetical protein
MKLKFASPDNRAGAAWRLGCTVARVLFKDPRFGARSNYAKSNQLRSVPVPNVYLFGTVSTENPDGPVPRVYTQIMKWWLVGFLVMVALLLSGYAVYKARRLESATKPQIHPIASAFAR